MREDRRRSVALGALLALLGACRDLTLPPPPGPGSVTGQSTFARPGRSERAPAVGAQVSVLGTGLSSVTNPGGTFTLAWGEATGGVLLVRFDADGDGAFEHQRVVDLSTFGVGANRQVDLGEVVLGENATVRGRVLRGDVHTSGGHAGSTVFVPSGPFAASTADDGSFVFDTLPPGPLSLVVFRPGYLAHAFAPVDLRAGEQVTLVDAVLEPGVDAPAAVTGAVAFVPDLEGVGDTQVMLEASAASRTATVDAARTFRLEGVSPGLYRVRASRTGFTTLLVPNVLVPGGSADLGTLVLTDQPALDAGSQPKDAGVDAGAADGGPDGGSDAGLDGGSDAGLDGGFDAGVDAGIDAGIDAGTGCVQGSCASCRVNRECPATEWCDQGRCTSQCTSAASCTLGRTCDTLTHTCVLACQAGLCAVGSACDVTATGPAFCRAQCDGTFPCGPGLVCDARGLCVPECVTAADCRGFSVCHAGQCEPSGACADDAQCPVEQLCFAGSCVQRPTARVDGGAFACSGPCQCRQGEWCHLGLCEVELAPTVYLQAGALGDGRTPGTPTGDLRAALVDAGANARFALRVGDTFTAPTGFTISSGHDHFALRGGYTACSSTRWVRSDATRSTLASDAGTTLVLAANTDVEVANLVIRGDSWTSNTCEGPLLGSRVTGLKLSQLDLTLDDTATTCGSGVNAASIDDSSVTISDLTATLHATHTDPTVLRLYQCQADVRRVTLLPPSQSLRGLALLVADVTGPSTFSGFTLPALGGSSVVGLFIASCAAGSSALVEQNTLTWSRAVTTTSSFTGISVVGCADATVRDNVVDGAGPVAAWGAGAAVSFVQSAGRIERNLVRLPQATNGNNPGQTAGNLTGVYVSQLVGAHVVSDNVVTGGSSPVGVVGAHLAATGPGGTLTCERNTLDVGPAKLAYGLVSASAAPANALVVRDNFVRAQAITSCTSAPVASGIYAPSATGLFERNRVYAAGGTQARAFVAEPRTTDALELYANHLWSGPASCAGSVSAGVTLRAGGGQVFLGENTIDAQGDATTSVTAGVSCEDSALFLRGNLVGGGFGLARLALGGTGAAGCYVPANVEANLFWLPPDAGVLSAQDFATSMSAASGWPASNVSTAQVSPYDAVQPLLSDGGATPPSRLAASSAAVDHGVWPVRRSTSVVLLDLDGAPRDAGAGPDMGCCERR